MLIIIIIVRDRASKKASGHIKFDHLFECYIITKDIFKKLT